MCFLDTGLLSKMNDCVQFLYISSTEHWGLTGDIVVVAGQMKEANGKNTNYGSDCIERLFLVGSRHWI